MDKRVKFEEITTTDKLVVGVMHFDKEYTELLLPTDPELLEGIAELMHDLADKYSRVG